LTTLVPANSILENARMQYLLIDLFFKPSELM